MSQAQIERRLRISKRHDRRDDLAITEEQLISSPTSRCARLRALVSETPLAERARKAAATPIASGSTATPFGEVAALDAEQDELLDRFGATSDIRVVVAEDEAIIRMDLVSAAEGYDVVAHTARR